MEIHANLWEIFGSHLIKKLKTLKIKKNFTCVMQIFSRIFLHVETLSGKIVERKYLI